MANAQLAEEELQQSVMMSEEDAEFEEDIAPEAMEIDHTPATVQHDNGVSDHSRNENSNAAKTLDGEGDADQPISENEQFDTNVPERELVEDAEDEDAEGEPDDFDNVSHVDDGTDSRNGSNHDGEPGSDEDAEGEDDDMPPLAQNGVLSEDEDEEEEEEAEGVGAVKIKPGETDEDESASEDGATYASGESDQESGGEWESEAANEDDEDEESEVEVTNLCMFCKKDEEHDPGEEFESFLACKSCGEHGEFSKSMLTGFVNC